MQVDYAHIVDFLIKEFPEFTEIDMFKLLDEEELKLPYVVWAGFAKYAVEIFQKNGAGDPVLQRLFHFINEQFADPDSDSEVLNLLGIEVFENFAQTKESLEFSRKNTTNKARHEVEMSLAYTGVDKPDLTIAPEAEAKMKSIRDWNDKQSGRK